MVTELCSCSNNFLESVNLSIYGPIGFETYARRFSYCIQFPIYWVTNIPYSKYLLEW